MVNKRDDHLDLIFYALADPTRRAILLHLANGDSNVSKLPNPLGISKAAISKHLAVLNRASLVEGQRHGRLITCRANLDAVQPAVKLLEELGEYWRARLSALEKFLEGDIKEIENNEEQVTPNSIGNKKSTARKSRKGL